MTAETTIRKKQAARKPRGKLEVTEFWEESRLLSSNKVKRILKQRGFDTNAFAKDYIEDTSRGTRADRPPSAQQIEAVEIFLKDGDAENLKENLELKTSAAALNMVSRVQSYLASGGQKTIRRQKR